MCIWHMGKNFLSRRRKGINKSTYKLQSHTIHTLIITCVFFYIVESNDGFNEYDGYDVTIKIVKIKLIKV